MSDINFLYIGWCNEGTSDKIWCAITVGGNYYAAWGARGKKVSFKKHNNRWELSNVQEKKARKYMTIPRSRLDHLVPDFAEKVDECLVMAILSDKVR